MCKQERTEILVLKEIKQQKNKLTPGKDTYRLLSGLSVLLPIASTLWGLRQEWNLRWWFVSVVTSVSMRAEMEMLLTSPTPQLVLMSSLILFHDQTISVCLTGRQASGIAFWISLQVTTIYVHRYGLGRIKSNLSGKQKSTTHQNRIPTTEHENVEVRHNWEIRALNCCLDPGFAGCVVAAVPILRARKSAEGQDSGKSGSNTSLESGCDQWWHVLSIQY